MRGREHHLAFLLLLWAAIKIAVHLLVPEGWELHRDEYLYLALGNHVAWGYWSTAPFIGAISWLVQTVSDAGPVAVRVPAILASIVTMCATGWMAHRLGGRRGAVSLACLAVLVSPGFLRSGSMLMPVSFDVMWWTLGTACVVGYLSSGKRGWIVALGPVVGIGLLTKYSMGLFVVALAVAVLLTNQRRMLLTRATAAAAALAAIIVLPNLVWQAGHGFPVVAHMTELARTQLVNVNPADYLLDQFLTYLPAAVVWIIGLVWLFRARERTLRILGWLFVVVLAAVLALSGKSYYTMGVYPVLIAAGGTWLDRRESRWPLLLAALYALSMGFVTAPYSMPVLTPEGTVRYGDALADKLGTDAPRRWEDGRYYDLPQDYADMQGWKSLSDLVARAVDAAPDSGSTVVYAENYGQAGAIEYFGGAGRAGPVISFNDSFRLWAPDSLPADLAAFVYVNDELGPDIDSLFAEVYPMGAVNRPTARERGTTVYLCLSPDPAFRAHYAERLAEVKAATR